MEDARMSDEPLYAYVGRQAIFDRQLGVVAYELLYRNSEENRAEFSDANEATAATILNAFVELGLEDLVGELPIYVNLPSDFLLGRYPIPLPPDRTFIEVLEDVPVTAPGNHLPCTLQLPPHPHAHRRHLAGALVCARQAVQRQQHRGTAGAGRVCTQ
jgi:hypothetical protein